MPHLARLTAALLTTAVAAATLSGPAEAAVARPGRVTAVTARPGPAAGQVTFTWRADGSNTTRFVIETALTTFKVGDPVLPDHGRGARYFSAGRTARSLTISAAAAGAPAGSANHLYYRLKAVNRTRSGAAERPWPYLQNVPVQPAPPAARGVALRVASFNVRTNTPSPGVRPWLQRVSGVAATIASRRPGVVAVQELNPGRADALPLSTTGSVRQTESLVTALRGRGLAYQAVRTTAFVRPGSPAGSQGARILFDTARYRQVSSCPQTTGRENWNSSCAIPLPILRGDSAAVQRRAAYVQLQDRASGRRFWVASVHLDARHSSNRTTERRYEQLRASQVRTVMAAMDRVNTARLPVVLAGDINTWQNNQGGYDAHDALVAGGYYDTAAAVTQVNTRWTTMNHFARTLTPSPSGWGSRLDVITVKGVRGAVRFENVMKVTDSARPSDHNMVVADLRLP